MKGNTDECHLTLSAGDLNQVQTWNLPIKANLCEKLLGVKYNKFLACQKLM